MKGVHLEAAAHVRGDSQYVDDLPEPRGMLHGVVVFSEVAHGTLRGIDASKALAAPGVRAVISAKDVPGENVLGPIVRDETLFAESGVYYIGQPIALVVADTPEQARRARQLVEADIEPIPAVTDPRAAYAKGNFLTAPRTFALGDVDAGFAEADLVVRGQCDMRGQEHLYLETNRARAMVTDGGRVTVNASTQSPYAAQKAIAKILGLSEHLIEIDVRRLGGGFGGKEDQATHFAAMASVAAMQTRRPVQIVLSREDDLQITGKRHPYEADFEIGVKSDGTIVAFRAMLYQNSGAFTDLSPPVLARSLFHATGAYYVPNVHVRGACCRTNIQPHTAYRGFGGPQGMFVIEAAIAKAAERLGIAREEVQRRNLIQKGQSFSYGQEAEEDKAVATWEMLDEEFGLGSRRARVEAFNAATTLKKRGLAVMPVCFGISFTKTFLNQASALVHIYTDGSVSVSTGGIEMGQGVSSNVARLAADSLGIPIERVKVESTNTTRIANMSPSAASATTDLNGHATLRACEQLRARLVPIAKRVLGVAESIEVEFADGAIFAEAVARCSFEEVVMAAYLDRTPLSAHGFYATPGLAFDGDKEKGRAFAYHVYGAALFEVEVDCLRGTYVIDEVCVIHDLGRSINPLIDLGQVEGGMAQGIGWMTLEDLHYHDDGRLFSRTLSTYKAPDVYATPRVVDVRLIESDNPAGPRSSKAVGEPPFMYGIGVYFALRDAMRAFAPEAELPLHAPLTPERVLMGLHESTPRSS